jgi:uncharacterized membrane protein
MYYCVYYSCAICVILVMCIWVYLQVLEMWDFDGSILLRSKYLQRDISTKINFFGAFLEFLGLR